MGNGSLLLAAGLTVAIGFVHSILGERYILTRLFRRELPKLFGSDWFTKRTLRFAWHLLSVAWWGLAAMLYLAADGHSPSRGEVLWVIAVVFGLSGVTALVASRGRHLSWIVFLAIALLTGLAAQKSFLAVGEWASLVSPSCEGSTSGATTRCR